MSRSAGLWIDHRQAVVITVEDDQTTVQHIASGARKRVSTTGAIRFQSTYSAPHTDLAEDKQERRYADLLRRYYAAVTAALAEAEAIVILGPGEARLELRQYLIDHGLGGRIRQVEAADKMTDRQIAAAVKMHLLAG